MRHGASLLSMRIGLNSAYAPCGFEDCKQAFQHKPKNAVILYLQTPKPQALNHMPLHSFQVYVSRMIQVERAKADRHHVKCGIPL